MKYYILSLCLIVVLAKGIGAVDSSTCTYSSSGCAFPDANQSSSYTETVGEDHDYASSVSTMSFTIYNGVDWGGTATSSVTVDNRTGLMWVTNMVDAGVPYTSSHTWQGALSLCEGLTYAGFSDWRLPNVRELMSIVDYGKTTGVRINVSYFPRTQLNSYWTSTTYAPFSVLAHFVKFNLGSIDVSNKTSSYYFVRCVRAGPP
ncbi:MAG: DUF1566 domain-containing protein [Elusimicrobiales bacterium]